MESKTIYEVGPYRLDATARILLNGPTVVPLTPKVFDLLLTLVERPGQLIAKDELIRIVWPDTFVEESNLTSNISILRKLLGTNPDGGEYIETIPKRGYRLVAAVRLSQDAAGAKAHSPKPKKGWRVSLRWALGAAVGMAIVVLGGLHFVGSFHRIRAWRSPRIEALAVLPLENLSGDPAQEFFADGMTEALTADLAQISALRVIARNSVMQYKGTRKSLQEIAETLKVDAVIRGSVTRSGRRVRVIAALIEPATDRHLWTMTYERDLRDVLDLQNEIARTIADEINTTLTPREQNRLARRRPLNPEAYEAYLRGRYFWNQYTEPALLKSIDYFRQAVQIDTNYAEAYAGLSDAWMGLLYIGAATFEDVRPKAFEAARNALHADDSLAESHGAMLMLDAQDWNWTTAESECQTALALNPGYVVAHLFHSNILRYLGRTTENITEAKLVNGLDPASPLANEALADAYFSARQYDLAIDQYLKTLELSPDRPASLDNLGWAHIFLGDFAEGIADIKKSGEDPELSPELAYVYAIHGEKRKAERILERLLSLSKRTPIAAHHFALVYAGLDRKREALEWLDTAYQEHSPLMTRLKIDARFDRLRSTPQFQDLMRRVGLI